MHSLTELYGIPVTTIDGHGETLEPYRGQALLVVNVASQCALSYDVTFPMFAKIAVNGAGEHPLYALLKSQARGVLGTTAIKWNFTKFLIDRDGTVLTRYSPRVTPEDIEKDPAFVAALAGTGN